MNNDELDNRLDKLEAKVSSLKDEVTAIGSVLLGALVYIPTENLTYAFFASVALWVYQTFYQSKKNT
jgi:hypothetical protein